MCASMADIQSATAEIGWGQEKRKKKPQGKNIMSTSATQNGHNNCGYKQTNQFNGVIHNELSNCQQLVKQMMT